MDEIRLKSIANESAISDREIIIKENNNKSNYVKASLDKIEFLEKQLHLRTEAEILISQVEQQNENQLLRGQIESSDEDGNIYDRLAQEKDSNCMKMTGVNIFIVSVMAAYFIT